MLVQVMKRMSDEIYTSKLVLAKLTFSLLNPQIQAHISHRQANVSQRLATTLTKHSDIILKPTSVLFNIHLSPYIL